MYYLTITTLDSLVLLRFYKSTDVFDKINIYYIIVLGLEKNRLKFKKLKTYEINPPPQCVDGLC